MSETKCSFIALIGSPNAGKSTLLNQLIGSKISIVSPKVQTTRNIIHGITIHEDSQLIFVDTPGIFHHKVSKKLEQAIVSQAWSGISGVNQIAVLVDAKRGICENTQLIIQGLKNKNIRAELILNKTDLVKKPELLALAKQLQQYEIFNNIFMVSALKNDGIFELKQFFAKQASPGPWLYPEDEMTTIPKRFLAAEIVREKLFLFLQNELPYNLTVVTDTWEELDNNSAKLHQTIYTNRASHKKIIIGQNGQMLKKVGETARLELEKLFDQKIHLFLFVKIRENWMDKDELMPISSH
ncbi:GTPase Era [Rickettsiales bacterium Ac37b]|nr:GTPase Era [Rickettsiales bacterium Ac37b]